MIGKSLDGEGYLSASCYSKNYCVIFNLDIIMNFSFGLSSTPTTSAPPTVPTGNTTLAFPKPTAKPASFALSSAKSATPPAKTETPKPPFNITAPSAALTFSMPPATVGAVTPSKTEPSKTGFGLSTGAPATSAPGFSLSTSAPSTGGGVGSVPLSSSMTYSQVEDLLNKWTAELAEQETVFQEQVKQVNGWDKILSDNSAKLTKLHTTIDKVRQQQKKINYDLDFVLQQQKELENALTPLEKEYSSSNYHPDVQRERMYQTAETIDAQIKKMSEDVKETIEHVNETAPSQEKSHPILQIGRVLNAHMNTLQWIDENSAQLQSHIESMSKYLDNIK